MAAPIGFDWSERKNGDVAIRHHGREVMVLRGASASRVVARLDRATDDEAQHIIARATGNYRRGNERP